MKKILFLILFGVFFFQGRAQVVNNLVVFINEAEPFTLIMNGERYNQEAQTRVRVTGLTLKMYKVTILFKNPDLKPVNTTLTFFSTGRECEFVLNKKGKKKHSMDYFTEKAIHD